MLKYVKYLLKWFVHFILEGLFSVLFHSVIALARQSCDADGNMVGAMAVYEL